MARIRSSKPEWWKSAKWCRLSRDIRSTYKGIWEVMCDDEGRFLADPRQVKADVWPLDDDITPKKLASWLPKLATVTVTLPDGRVPAVQFYEVEGIKYGFLPGFVKHQKISHPTPSKLPAPPEILASNSGNAPEILRPEEERDLDKDRDKDLERDEEAAPRVVLPPVAERFLAQFYEPALSQKQRDRYRDVQSQLYEILDPLHPGPKIRGGQRSHARSEAHFIDCVKAVIKDPPPNRDLAIVWLLNKLLDPEKGPTVTELAKRRDEQDRTLEERYRNASKQAGVKWANEHADDYQKILAAVEAHYRGKTGTLISAAKEMELVQRTAKAAGFPSFETWRSQQQPGVNAA